MRLGILLMIAAMLAACGSSSAPAPAGATESAAMVRKKCDDPHWRQQNLGLWYSICPTPMRW
jgi:hypothetical protein